jgi:TetR/AcrR family transcriptional regulator, tetracycline repressor protein
MALTREEIIRTAIGLLEQDGLQGLTLRRLARALGVSAPTLYWHVRDKRQLLDLMVERMMTDGRDCVPSFPENIEWWEKVTLVMRRHYDVLTAHRDAPLAMAGNRPTEAMLPWIENWLGLWIGAGFPPEEALSSILAMGNFVLGSALEYQAEVERARAGVPEPMAALKDQYPRLKQAIAARAGVDHHASFEHGLRLIVNGLRQRQAELLAEGAAPRQTAGGDGC